MPDKKICPTCKGTGKVPKEVWDKMPGKKTPPPACMWCNGTGMVKK